MAKNKLYYAETGMGATMIVATTENAAHNKVLKKVGTENGVQLVREATAKDIASVKAMNGYIPDVK